MQTRTMMLLALLILAGDMTLLCMFMYVLPPVSSPSHSRLESWELWF